MVNVGFIKAISRWPSAISRQPNSKTTATKLLCHFALRGGRFRRCRALGWSFGGSSSVQERAPAIFSHRAAFLCVLHREVGDGVHDPGEVLCANRVVVGV